MLSLCELNQIMSALDIIANASTKKTKTIEVSVIRDLLTSWTIPTHHELSRILAAIEEEYEDNYTDEEAFGGDTELKDSFFHALEREVRHESH